MRITLAAVAAVTVLVACASPSAHGKEAEAEAAIAALEKDVPLPDASRALAGYDRYYAISENRIEAVYLSSGRGSGRIHHLERRDLPRVKDGGCSVVNIVFDRTSNRFARILCNGLRTAHLEPGVGAVGNGASGGERG